MGTIYKLSCSQCGCTYSPWLGIGFGFSTLLKKSVYSFISGKHGELCQLFFEENPNGKLDCNYVLLQCKKCRALECDIDYAMYIPIVKKRKHRTEIQARRMFSLEKDGTDLHPISVLPKFNLKSDTFVQEYELYSEYDHRCKKCQGVQRIIRENYTENIIDSVVFCPKCNTEMTIELTGFWD